VGVPAGGTAGQLLTKNTATSYDTIWSSPAGTGTVTSFSAGNLSPLFTTSVTNSTTTPALSFALSTAGAHQFLGNNTGSTAAPTYVQPAFTDLTGAAGTAQGGLPTGGTAAQVLSKNSATNYDASWATLSSATFQSGASSSTGTTSTTGVMAGLAYAITPVRTGKVFVSISGSVQNTVAGGQCLAQIRYGTGTAPINGAALTGTAIGAYANGHSGGIAYRLPFNLTAVITGLTPGTPIWFDLSQSAVAASGTASVINVAGTAYELP
jgi:hypothetical protein